MTNSIDDLINKTQKFDYLNPDEGWIACKQLSEYRNGEEKTKIVRALTAVMNSKMDAATRAEAAQALGLFKDQDSIGSLHIALKEDKHPLVRSYAARSLGECGNYGSVEPLLKTLLDDDFFGARAEAAESLGKIGIDTNDVKIANMIKETLLERLRREKDVSDDRSERVKREIRLALGKIEERLIESRDKLTKETENAKSSGKDTSSLNKKLEVITASLSIITEVIKIVSQFHPF